MSTCSACGLERRTSCGSRAKLSPGIYVYGVPVTTCGCGSVLADIPSPDELEDLIYFYGEGDYVFNGFNAPIRWDRLMAPSHASELPTHDK